MVSGAGSRYPCVRPRQAEYPGRLHAVDQELLWRAEGLYTRRMFLAILTI